MSLLSKAAKHAAHEAEKAAQDAADAVSGAAQDAADTLKQAGKVLVDAWHDVTKAAVRILDDNTLGIRGLRGPERDILREVYEKSLPPLEHILIVGLIGGHDRPFTIPASFLAAVVTLCDPSKVSFVMLEALAAITGKRQDIYLIFMGRKGYNDGIHGFKGKKRAPLVGGEVLVHEACHIWQGYQNAFTWGYIIDSIYHQGQELVGGPNPYKYDHAHDRLKQWDQYEAEQQAQIVEDWFAGRDLGNFPYIRDNVRPGRPHATTHLPSDSTASGTASPAKAAFRGVAASRTLPGGMRR
jgi:hypothetical protein